ncbi:unnamed protein product [Caenorhabditis bovis]|uniref:FUN14 domain-containing protein 1 n=1 Tax=Caenorhabditis bovis TaxID=2654633 RepID=A0A8S1EWU7_9PELO|nr:unnamed protein product [Caenorhabditis bovis]
MSKGSDIANQALSFIVDLKKKPPMVQMGVGAGVGTVSGYLMTKGGRMVAATVGASFLLAQFAIHKGYITVDETKIQRDLKNLKKSVLEKLEKNKFLPDMSESFVSEHRWILGGFAAGVLIGFSLG